MAYFGRFIHVAPLLVLCSSMRPELRPSLELNKQLSAVSWSLWNFQESATNAGLDHVDGVVDASQDALNMVKVEQGKEFPSEAKAALERVIQVIKDTMLPTLDDLHTEDQELVNTIHEEVTECNTGMTNRLEGDIGENQKDAERLRGEEADLALQVQALQNRNNTKHEQLKALMSNKQIPLLCDAFPHLPVEELWEDYYQKVAEYSATAVVEAKNLEDQRSERDSIVSSLVSTTEKHVSTSAALSVSFCDWKRNLLAACSTHDTCYADKSAHMQGQLEFFSGARDKRIAAYRSALKLIDDLNKMMLENPEPMNDDAETRFPPNDKEVPEKAECDLGVLDEWDASTYGCGDQVSEGECEGVTNDSDSKKCSSVTGWHSSILPLKASKLCIPVVTMTHGSTCKQFCEDQAFDCVRAQDNVGGGCSLDDNHDRQTTADNGCHQKWTNQVCQCGHKIP